MTIEAKDFIIGEIKKDYPDVDEKGLREKLNKSSREEILRLVELVYRFNAADIIAWTSK